MRPTYPTGSIRGLGGRVVQRGDYYHDSGPDHHGPTTTAPTTTAAGDGGDGEDGVGASLLLAAAVVRIVL